MKIRTILALIATLLFSTFVSAKVHTGIEVKLQSVKQSQGNDEDVFVKVTYHNKSNQNIKILKWYMPDENGEVEEGIFKISRDGQVIDYLGPHYKRPAAVDADYFELAAHKKAVFTVELSGLYDFSEQGYYQVELDVDNLALYGPLKPIKPGKDQKKDTFTGMKSNMATSVMVAKVRAAKGKPCNPRKEDCGGNGSGDDVSFTGACSNSEQNSILSALDAAKTMANDSVSYLNGNAGSRYTTWFGTYSNSRWNKVASNFDSIKDALDNKSKTFDCSCNQRYYAYVYPSQPYKVYLCKAFWSASLTGTDSKAGTIIHEISHFNVVAGTDDIVYGQTGAKNLAISNPDDAVKNADSHEYFAENTPYQN
ncbi:MAG: M35 family metallo-endopeptidase [Kangiellaceae bacterium]|nr:M35 family metallo-endopeptidase [Kangiellaceae bacterium]